MLQNKPVREHSENLFGKGGYTSFIKHFQTNHPTAQVSATIRALAVLHFTNLFFAFFIVIFGTDLGTLNFIFFEHPLITSIFSSVFPHPFPTSIYECSSSPFTHTSLAIYVYLNSQPHPFLDLRFPNPAF